MLCFMSYIGPEISSYNAVPCGIIFFIEFFLYICGDILHNVFRFKCIVNESKNIEYREEGAQRVGERKERKKTKIPNILSI